MIVSAGSKNGDTQVAPISRQPARLPARREQWAQQTVTADTMTTAEHRPISAGGGKL
jgi:hypothetical protein